MPIAKIVEEIDAYLSLLRKTREILVGARTQARKKGATLRKPANLHARIKPATWGRSLVDESRSRSDVSTRRSQKIANRAGTAVPALSESDSLIPQPQQGMGIQPEPSGPQSGLTIQRIPPRRRFGAVGSMRSRAAKPALGGKLDGMKPAISLAGSMKGKIVVVTAEQIRQERELAAPVLIPRTPLPVPGLRGKMAFESLFKDTSKHS